MDIEDIYQLNLAIKYDTLKSQFKGLKANIISFATLKSSGWKQVHFFVAVFSSFTNIGHISLVDAGGTVAEEAAGGTAVAKVTGGSLEFRPVFTVSLSLNI